MIFARHLPDVEGLGGRVGQEAEHQDDGVGVGKTFRVDLSVREARRDVNLDLLSTCRDLPVALIPTD